MQNSYNRLQERLKGTEVPRLACIERTEVSEFSASRISFYNWLA